MWLLLSFQKPKCVQPGSSCLCRVGDLQGPKRRVYIPLFLWGLLNSHYFKEYTVQGNGYFSSRSVQGCIQAELANRKNLCMEYSPYVNSVVYIIG